MPNPVPSLAVSSGRSLLANTIKLRTSHGDHSRLLALIAVCRDGFGRDVFLGPTAFLKSLQ